MIEPSGICEPAPIAQTICSIPALGPEYVTSTVLPRLDCIVTVVDALRMQSEFSCGDTLPLRNFDEEDLESLVIEQIEFCNLVLLNKASEIRPEELARVRSVIRNLNPGVEIIDTDFCDVPLNRILGTGLFNFDKVATSAAWIAEIEGEGLHNEEEGEADEYGVGTYVYTARPALDINRFDEFVAKHWPTTIIRTKGLVYFSDDKDKCLLFEQSGVQKTIKDAGWWFAAMPKDQLAEMMLRDKNLSRDWDPVYGDRMIKLVFIGQNLDKEALKAEMDACLEKA